MKIVHPLIEIAIDFKINNCYTLVVENPNEFYNLTSELYQQTKGNEGAFILSDNSILNIEKEMLLIYDYYNISFSSKKIVNLINNDILQLLKKNDFIEDFSAISTSFIKLSEKISQELDYELEFEDNFCFEDFIKFSNFKIRNADNLLENLITFVDLFIKLTNIKIVSFINISNFLNENEMIELIKQLNYFQVKILFLESQDRIKSHNLKKIIIDQDLCII